MAAKLYIKKVKEKMDMLKSDRAVLQEVLNDYVDAVLSEADKWVASTESPGRSYRDICGILDECSNFITEKSGEIAIALGKEDEEGEDGKEKKSDTAAAASLSASSSLPPSLSSLPGAFRSTPREDYNFLKIKERIDNLENDRENLEKKLKEIADVQITALSSKMDVVEKRQERIGFSAHLAGSTPTVNNNTVVQNFTTVITNIGGHFNPSTGQFTTPIDGVYVTGISHTGNGSTASHLRVLLVRSSTGVEEEVCSSFNAHAYQMSTCGMGIVDLKKNDILYVKVTTWNTAVKYPGTFSCFFIG